LAPAARFGVLPDWAVDVLGAHRQISISIRLFYSAIRKLYRRLFMTIDTNSLLAMYQTMVKIRRFETRASEWFAAGEVPGFIHLFFGQEASAVGICSVLREDDYISTTHRGHGHIIAKGARLKPMVAELFARATGYCKGKGGSMHIADFSLGILGANGVVAGGLPIMTGAGLSIKMRKTDQVAVVFFGDGASNRGPVHEAMNMCAIWKLPVIFVVENNQFASTTAQSDSCSVGDICSRAAGYEMPGVVVDGNDVVAVREAAAEAVARAREGKGPSFLENKTYRYRGHFEGDPQRYRTVAEIENRKKTNDPIDRFEKLLMEKKFLDKQAIDGIRNQIDTELAAAATYARQSPYPEPEAALDDLYVNP
jgi:acetoin:2,6-dichlorophenolindophenol oxidoreductase subunit alpha